MITTETKQTRPASRWIVVGRDFLFLALGWLVFGTLGSLIGTLIVFAFHRRDVSAAPWLWAFPTAVLVALIFKFATVGHVSGF